MPLFKVKRNCRFVPVLDEEGIFTRPLKVDAADKYEKKMTANIRLFSHHTLCSARKFRYYYSPMAPKDSLDLRMTTSYNHSKEVFPDKMDIYMQWETRNKRTWRKLRNTFDDPIPQPLPLSHPLKIGGITERRSPHHVKLINPSNHAAKALPGYSRKPSGGAIYYY